MVTRLQALRRNDFVRHNAIFWMASLGVAALNYLYYPVIGRFLPSDSFGEVQTILSFLTQLGIFFQVLGLVSVGIIARYTDQVQRDKVMGELSRLTLFFAGAMVVITVAVSPLLKGFFRFDSVLPFLLLAASLLISMASSFASAYLQGHKRFGKLAFSNTLGASLKLLLAFVFVLAGGKTMGAVGGLLCAQVVTLIYMLRAGSGVRRFITDNFHTRLPDIKLVKPELPYAGVVLLSALASNLLLSLDILVVKHYFPPSLAGLYSGISIISNAIYYISGPFAMVLLPSLQPNGPKAANFALLKRSLGLTSAVGGGAMLLFVIVPHFVVNTLLGHTYAPYASYLRGLALALFIMSIANLLIYYHLGLRNYLVAPFAALGVVMTLIIIGVSHASLAAIVTDLVAGATIVLVLLIGLTVQYHVRTETTTA